VRPFGLGQRTKIGIHLFENACRSAYSKCCRKRNTLRYSEEAKSWRRSKDPSRLWSLQELATELGVHVRTLPDAARSGRLKVTCGNRIAFENPISKSTIAAGRGFLRRYCRQSYSRFVPKPRAPKRTRVPPDCAPRLLEIRRRLRFTQTELDDQIGAAGKAVVYQWESGKRKPSPLFWEKIQRLRARDAQPF
jgi:DNA-binding XRE family transcriptional regulator